jgi:peptide/nickel transport system permease protein
MTDADGRDRTPPAVGTGGDAADHGAPWPSPGADSSVPDAESLPPLAAPEAGAPPPAGDEPPPPRRRPVPSWAPALSVVLPGSGQLVVGAWTAGIVLLASWLALLAVIFFARDRIAATPVTGTMHDWVALTTLLLTLAAVWHAARRDLLHPPQPAGGAGDSQWRIAARHLRRNTPALVGLGVVVVFYLVALMAPLLAPFDPIVQHDIVRTRYLPPSLTNPLGTDGFGRDVLSRILYGARISLSIAFVAVAISISLGTLLGAVAGYLGGIVDTAIMRFTDLVLAFPRLVLMIMIIAFFSPSITLIILVLGLTLWPGTARIVRGEVLSLREREFIQAARALGLGRSRIIFRHLVPNVLAPVIVAATLGIGNTIVLEAGLSFLGLGVQPPTPSWGNMVADGRDNLIGAWWVATFPGLTVVATVLAFNLVGDGLRDALDPRLRS